MTCEEAEALCLLTEKHGAEVSVTETDLAVCGNGAGDAERLKPDSDSLCGVGSVCKPLLYCDCTAESVCPACVVECDRLNALDDSVNVDAFCKADVARVFEVLYAVFLHAGFDARHSSFFAFKLYVV